jgi:hypothetical protein
MLSLAHKQMTSTLLSVADICAEVTRRYTARMDPIYDLHDGGKIRAARGNLVEDLVRDCCELVGLEWRKGTQDLQTIVVGEFSKNHQVDGHIYKNGAPAVFIESKAYLDSCYYVRAVEDFKLMKLRYPTVPCVVVALEKGGSDDAFAFTNAVNVGACSSVVYLCDGKRSSSRPMYQREFAKPIQQAKLEALVRYLQSV